MADYTVKFNLDRMTLGDMELMERAGASGRFSDMLAVFDRNMEIEGVAQEDVPAVIRSWTIAEFKEISAAIAEQVKDQTNPVVAGKN